MPKPSHTLTRVTSETLKNKLFLYFFVRHLYKTLFCKHGIKKGHTLICVDFSKNYYIVIIKIFTSDKF